MGTKHADNNTRQTDIDIAPKINIRTYKRDKNTEIDIRIPGTYIPGRSKPTCIGYRKKKHEHDEIDKTIETYSRDHALRSTYSV